MPAEQTIVEKKEYFTSRWGMILSVIWVIFLLIWSVPLMITEFAIGNRTRKGTVGAIALLAGPKFGWMGAFVWGGLVLALSTALRKERLKRRGE